MCGGAVQLHPSAHTPINVPGVNSGVFRLPIARTAKIPVSVVYMEPRRCVTDPAQCGIEAPFRYWLLPSKKMLDILIVGKWEEAVVLNIMTVWICLRNSGALIYPEASVLRWLYR